MIPRVCAIAVVGAIVIKTLSEMGLKSLSAVKTLVLVLILTASAEPLSQMLRLVSSIEVNEDVSEGIVVMTKGVGLGYVFGFTSDICASLGEGELASGVVTVGRVQIFLLALPYLTKIIALGLELMG